MGEKLPGRFNLVGSRYPGTPLKGEITFRLTDHDVNLNLSKCTFGLKEVTFLGHRISAAGSKPDPKNIEAVAKTKAPTTVNEIRRFLGMCGFYWKHVQSFAKIAAPLTNLTRTNTIFKWTEQSQQLFEQLQACQMNTPVLVKAQVNQPFLLTTDASSTHIGGVRCQIQSNGSKRPIGFFSKKLNPCESRYSATDKEVLAVILACRNFHHYRWCTRFTVITDHQPLTSIFKRKTKSPRMNRWILEVREYNYKINYLKGKDNFVADHLPCPVRIILRPPETS